MPACSDLYRAIPGFTSICHAQGLWSWRQRLRSDPRQQQRYRFQAAYTVSRWLSLDASFDILEHRNGMLYVNDKEHDRGLTLGAVLTPNDRLSVDFGYTYNNIYTQLIECWAYGSGVAPPVPPGLLPSGTITTPCPVPADLQGGNVTAFGGPAVYSSNTNFVYANVNWKPIKRLTLRVGYAGSFANGRTLFLNPNAPVGPLQYAYQKPYAGFVFTWRKASPSKPPGRTTGTTQGRFRTRRALHRSGAKTLTPTT